MSLSLPNDILLLVGEFLEEHQDRYNLVFVCRRFHDLLLRLVYRRATLKNASQTRSFLSALLRRPELARAVRSLHFDDWNQTPSPSPSSSSQNMDWSPFRNWAQTISQSEEELAQWEQDLLNDVEEAWIALALPLVNNLRQLRLVYPKESVYLDRTLSRALKGEKPFDDRPAFRVLQEVSLGHMGNEGDTKGSFAPSQISSFFQLPSMRALSADSVVESSSSPDNEHEQTTEMPQSVSSNISEITLYSSNGSKGMEGLIASCPSLRSFKYQHSDSHLLSEGYRPSEFARSLAASKGSLETLWLDSFGTHLPFTIAGANETHDEWFGSLADFTALKDIRIRLPNLLDVRYQFEPSTALPDVLPPSVQTLSVEGCKEMSLRMLIGQLKMVLGQRQKRFVGLRRLDIEGFFHDEEDEDASGYDAHAANPGGEKVIKSRVYEMTEALHTSCAEAGIELHLRDRDCPATMA
ncbi:hypothetical protein P170DRAFT_464059 [Aspergillus steynii IBT 23096]|uniref:Uncharacterized protein n=1 Tax=Aspergillus steynii IBT 23096 TaxID=1392250 RepID=A0A2I2GDR5_9EURO|nr:uncharacterized protein P170DRAFT_464059 [Aspergillus steynii IBT 23096]PLB51049.1 hypothetical protein P170DRAFT_464059 [Aspergillus steynii IBT 23096]